MFKLESYVTPWLLGYLDQYVKLRPEDLQLSLWGGDAVLYNLDIRLDVLQKAMQLPIVFKSGHIHELRLHVPWTKLGSEPIVITINTVECIVKVRDTAYSDGSSSASGSSASKASASAGRARRKLKRQATEELPPGYLQSILNRMVNNVTFIVNNLILKFVEDDIVLSVNVKSAECYSCDGAWNRAFVDMTPQDLALRRMINFSDLTICLDKSNVDGHIEAYQEPMLYRCFIACRLHMTYDSVSAKLPKQTKLNVMCDRLYGLMSDTQLPMFVRLIELCLALYYGYLDVPSESHEKDGINTSATQDPTLKAADEGEMEDTEETEDDQGWAAWMWSMVPQILPEDEEGGLHAANLHNQPPILSLGFYIQQASLTFKVTEKSREKSHTRGKKLTFHPFLLLEARGVGLEILMQGLTFFSVQCGIGHLNLTSLGPCICGQVADNSPQHSHILRSGEENKEGGLAYDWGSLFDRTCDQNQGVETKYVVDREEHLERYTEQYAQQRFEAFWMDYLSTLVLPRTSHPGGSQSSDTDSGETTLFQQESTTCRFVFGPSQLQITSSSVHRIHKVLCFAWDHQYEPYQSGRARPEGGERVQLTEAQLAELEELIPTCTYHVTLLQPSVLVAPSSHPACNVPAKLYSTHSQRSKSKTSAAREGAGEGMAELWASAQRIDLQLLSPMYPGRLVKLVSNIAGPSSNLLYHCHSHTQLKIFSLQAGLQPPKRRGAAWRPVILVPPCSTAFYFRSLLLPHLWNNSHLPLWERSYEVPQLSVTASKASIMVMVQLLASWIQPQMTASPSHQSLLSDLFPQQNDSTVPLCVLELSVSDLQVRDCHTPLVQAYTGSLSSLQLLLYTPGTGVAEAATVPVLCGPVNSSPVVNRATFQKQPVSCLIDGAECLAFTVQIPQHTSITEAPAVLLVSVEGVAGCLDPALLQWLSYTPRKHTVKLVTSDVSAMAVDVPLAQATSPLQTGGSHMSVRSGSSQTQPTTSRLFSHSQTPTHSRSHREGSSSHGDSSSDKQLSSLDSFTKLLISAFPLLRMMHVQVDIKSSSVFMPKTSVGVREASSDLAATVQTAWQSGWVGEVLVLCLPALSFHSVTSSPMDILQDIPITTLHGALLSEKLPWTVELSEWSVYSLNSGGGSQPLLSGLDITSTVGATVQYNPPTSDIIQSLALCLHLDLRPPVISLSHSQVGLLHDLIKIGSEMAGRGWQLADHCLGQLLPSYNTGHRDDTHDTDRSSGAAQHTEQSSSHTQPDTSLTGGLPEAGEAVTTDMSDDVSHHTSPLHTMVSPDAGSDRTVKLSLWLQCVLPRFTLRLFTAQNSGEVSMVMEDMALSCDMQHVYCKVKASLGSISIQNYVLRDDGERVMDAGCPVLVSTSRELPQHLNVYSNKLWTSDRQPSSARFSPQDTFSSDKMHGFFSLTFTRAVCKSVHRRMKKLNVELAALSEKEDKGPTQGFFFHQFVSEVCLKMEPVDVVAHLPTLERLLSMLHTGNRDHHQTSLYSMGSATGAGKQKKKSSSLVNASHSVPLLYMDVGTVRLFVPVGDPPGDSPAQQSPSSTLAHNFFLLQWASLHVQPHADNPLPRYPVERDVFHQALQMGMTQQMGSCVEDKQFQLKVHSLVLSSGLWADILHAQEEDSQSTKLTPGVQMPALEWNNYLGHRSAEKEIELIPMVSSFDLCLVVAPPIAFTEVDTDQHVLVCGLTAELNVVSDLDVQLSGQQLQLLTSLADQMMALPSNSPKGRQCQGGSAAPKTACQDSGVASEMSTSSRPDPMAGGDTLEAIASVPANVLLTAGRISVVLYTHLQLQSDIQVNPMHSSGVKHTGPAPHFHRQQSAKTTYGADNFMSLTHGIPSRAQADGSQNDCVPFSFIQPHLDSEGVEMKITAGAVCVQPFLYVYIAQPHTVLSTWPNADRLELSCYDVLVKGAQQNYLFPVTEQRVMPDHADFSLYWVETRAGQPDSKTGIPPSLLTLQICSLLTLPASVNVKLERPVRISLRDDTVSQVTDFLQHVSPAVCHDNTDKATRAAGVSSQGADKHGRSDWLPGVVSIVNGVSVRTEQVVFALECEDSAATSGLLASAESVSVALEQTEKTGGLVKVGGNMCWKGVALQTVYNRTQRPMAGPITVQTEGVLRWPRAGEATPPQVVISMQTGLLLLYVGQEHLLCLGHLLSVLSSKSDGGETSPVKKAKKDNPVYTEATQLSVLRPSHDDLRSGAFVYIHKDGECMECPAAYQAVFSACDDSDVDSALTWTYPEPRLITAIRTLPVPFGVHNTHTPDLSLTVSCKLQYWNECVEEFVTYASFELSEDSSSTVSLPEVRLANAAALVVARVWRVVLSQATDSSRGQQPSDPGATEREGVLLATQLAGSMCVDSVQIPSLVPSVQLSFSLPKLQVHLHNHLMYNGSELGGRLAGYKLSSMVPEDQQWGLISLDKVSFVSSHVTLPLHRSYLQLSCESGFEVVDYNSLRLQPVIDPVQVQGSVTVHHHRQPAAVECDIKANHLGIHLGRSSLHTLNTSLMAWSEFGESNEDSALMFAHVILCNNTQQTLRFGQAGTDENIILHSGHLYPYCWRSLTTKKQLHLCVDHSTWRWCTPLDISADGHAVRVVRAREQRYTLIILTKSLSSIHKQVTVSGQFAVHSWLSQAMEVRFQFQDSEDGQVDCVSLVEAGRQTPSIVAEHEHMEGVSVRLAGYNLPWSHTLHLSGNAMRSNQLLKVLLPDGVSFFHTWCRIFCQNFNETRQKLIFLSPLYVLRSHLPLPLHVNLLTPRTRQQQVLEVKGQGQEYQLHCTGGDVTHQLSFKLGPKLPESSPPVMLHSGLVDQVEQTTITEVDIQSLCEQQPPPLALDWPYTSLQLSSVCEEKRWSEVEQAGVDVNVQLSQYMPGCNTLLVDISPWCLLTNLTPLPLLLLSQTRQWALPQGCTVAPPVMQELQFGCEGEGQVWEATPIPLSGDEVEQHRYSQDIGKVLYLDGQVQLQLLLPPLTPGGLTQVVPLSVVSVMQHGIRIVTVSERIRLTNLSTLPLEAHLLAAPQTSVKLKLSNFKSESTALPVSEKKKSSQSTCALLTWQFLQDESLDAEPLELVLYMRFRITTKHVSSAPSTWSIPIRVASSQDGWRSTVALDCDEGDAGCLSLCVTCTVEGALTYVVVTQDLAPMCRIHNLCPFPLQYGQALDRPSFKGLTVQEETELVEAVPAVSSRRWSHYTMPHVNARFPQVDAGQPPHLHVRAVLPQDPQSPKPEQQQWSEWSAGIALDAGDTFLRMNGVASIKVNIQFESMVRHVTFSVLNKAEVSAREVRSRIQGGQEVTRVEGTAPTPTPVAAAAEFHAEEASSVGQDSEASGQPQECVELWPQITLGLLLERVELTLHDDVSQADITQLLQVELQQVLLACYPVGGTSSSTSLAVCMGSVQVDNPLAHQGLYDFPVLLQPQQTGSWQRTPLASQLDLTEVHAILRASSFFHVQFVVSRDPLLTSEWFLDSVEIAVRPVSVYFEDSYFYRLYEECLSLIPCRLSGPGSKKTRHSIPPVVLESARLHQQPLRIQHICVQPVSLLLSVHASVRLFLATDHAPLTLGRFERHRLFTGTQQLAYTMALHYITAAIFRAGMVVGSMDILGSPTGLVRSISAGLSDLLRLPYQGLTRSPAAFLTGIFGGMSSLMRNVSAGMMTSVTNFASSVSRNMDRLSLDSGHQQRQEETRRQRPTGLSSGLQQGLTGFGLSVLGAVAGLVDQPLQSVLAQQSSQGSLSAGRTASSIVTGVGKGLVGVLTKPIGGAAELVSQTGQGLLQGSGLGKHSGPRRSVVEIKRLQLQPAWLKYQMKVLAETSLLLVVKATQENSVEEVREVTLLLTGDMVVVVNQEEDAQQQAFALSQLYCHSPAPAILTLSVADTVFHNRAQMCNPDSQDRVAAFISSTTNQNEPAGAIPWASGGHQSDQTFPAPNTTDVLPSMGSTPAPISLPDASAVDDGVANVASSPSFSFRMDPDWCQLFVALFGIARNRQMGRGFVI